VSTIAREKRNHGGDLLRSSKATKGRHRLKARQELLALADAVALGLGGARRDRVHGDPASAELFCDHVRHRLDRSFGRVVDAVAGEHQAGRRARDVDDPSAVGHPLERQLAPVERAFHIDLEAVLELAFRHLAERLDERDGGVVDQHIPAAEAIDRRVHKHLECFTLAYVGCDGERLAAIA
jgi:hypothetical protein